MLSRFEATRVIGLRALDLAGGAQPNVQVHDTRLQGNLVYVAARELAAGRLDARVERSKGDFYDVRTMRMPPTLYHLLDTMDGGCRSYSGTI